MAIATAVYTATQTSASSSRSKDPPSQETAERRVGASKVAAALLRRTSTEDFKQGATLLEAALEAWADCQPDGCTLPESAVPLVLPAIACRIPGCYESAGTGQLLNDLFMPKDDDTPLFQKMLKAHNGQVHFLYFWSAFSKACRLLESINGDGSAFSMGKREEVLTLELETLRDGILRLLEMQAGCECMTVATAQLMEAVHTTTAMSSSSAFWLAAEEMLRAQGASERLTLEELTVLILSWLRGAIAWQHSVPSEPSSSDTPLTGQSPRDTFEVDDDDERQTCLTFTRQRPRNGRARLPVRLHIYDVSQEDSVHKLNKWLAGKNSPLKFGGVFHAGVEVNGLEWSYGMSLSETQPGISCVEPRMHPAHRYRQTVKLRSTTLSGEEIAELISGLAEEYPGDDYDLLRRNCCHFADDFCRRLGAGRIPGWVHRLARIGARVDSALHAVTGRTLLDAVEPDDTF
mmetsp:Transcript_22054/g.42343  ORF Transcript_22054/g.42343 Transcript_22054/m.42343 type:complete len:461 (-) Transcript_22054:123-1505(-)